MFPAGRYFSSLMEAGMIVSVGRQACGVSDRFDSLNRFARFARLAGNGICRE